MTVAELIDALNKVEDKSVEVIDWSNDIITEIDVYKGKIRIQ